MSAYQKKSVTERIINWFCEKESPSFWQIGLFGIICIILLIYYVPIGILKLLTNRGLGRNIPEKGITR